MMMTQVAGDRFPCRAPARAGETRALLAISLCVIAVASVGCRCPIPWGDCRVASFDCGHGRTIDLYVDSFCDVYTFVQYEVRDGGRVVVPKYLTRAGFPCDEWEEGTDPNSYRLVVDDTGNLAAVTFTQQGEEIVALVFDFDTQQGIPRSTPHPGVDKIPPEMLDRLGLAAQDS